MANRYACARCGKLSPAAQMVYSRITKQRYCADFAACDRRLKRQGGKK